MTVISLIPVAWGRSGSQLSKGRLGAKESVYSVSSVEVSSSGSEPVRDPEGMTS